MMNQLARQTSAHFLACAVPALVLGLGILGLGTLSAKAEVKPAIIYDLGGKFDKSFNEGAYRGAEKFTAETGIAYRDFEIQNDALEINNRLRINQNFHTAEIQNIVAVFLVRKFDFIRKA